MSESGLSNQMNPVERDAYDRLLDLLRDRIIKLEADVEWLKDTRRSDGDALVAMEKRVDAVYSLPEQIAAARVLDRLNALEEHTRTEKGSRR